MSVEPLTDEKARTSGREIDKKRQTNFSLGLGRCTLRLRVKKDLLGVAARLGAKKHCSPTDDKWNEMGKKCSVKEV